MSNLQLGLMIAGLLAVGGTLGAGAMALMVIAGEEHRDLEDEQPAIEVSSDETGITASRIAQLTISAFADCGTRTAIEIAAQEAYAAGRKSIRAETARAG